MASVFLESQKGKQKLSHEGHLYILNYSSVNGVNKWECAVRKKFGCPAKAFTKRKQVTRLEGDHVHPPNSSLCGAQVVMAKIRQQARNSSDPPVKILGSATASVPGSIVTNLPSHRNMGRTIGGVRKGFQTPLPTSLEALHEKFPEELQVTVTGDQFLLHDSWPVNPGMLIFSTSQNLQWLSESDHWFVDGTFKTVPSLFYQLFTIHGCFKGRVLPLVYVLLPNKSRNIYEELLIQVKRLKPGLKPSTIMMDYEQAVIGAFEISFPSSQIRGCFFHFQQSLWRQVQQHQYILNRYCNNSNFKLMLLRVSALAFRKVADVRDSYLILRGDNFFAQDDLQIFLDYFEKTWVGQPPVGNRFDWIEPLFPVRLWNVFSAVENDWAKTNNSVEGWHYRFLKLVGKSHANIFDFVNSLKTEENYTRQAYVDLKSGGSAREPNAKYLRIKRRIRNIIQEYDDLDAMDFLEAIAHNISF